MTISWDISELANGLRVVTTPVPTAQSVSVNLFVGTGSRAEERGVQGLAHFLEHMVFKGSEQRPSAMAIAEAIEGAGGVLNAYTTKEITCFWNHLPFEKLALAVDVLADMLLHPLLEAEEIERERSVVQQEIRRNHDQPGVWVGELLAQAIYGDQPLGWSTSGSEETVAAIQRQDFRDYMDAWYVPGNMVVSVAGNVSHAEVEALARRHFDGRPARAFPSFLPLDSNPPAAQRVATEGRPITQANVAMGLPAFPRKDPDRYALMMFNNLLGRGMSSRLFKEVRERRGLAYSVGSSVSRFFDTGLLLISAGVAPDKLKEAVRVILDELSRLVEERVSEEEMAKVRDYSVGNFRLGLETAMALGQRAGELLLTMDEIEPIEVVVEKLRAITADDILRVAGRVVRMEKVTLAVVGPEADSGELVELVAEVGAQHPPEADQPLADAAPLRTWMERWSREGFSSISRSMVRCARARRCAGSACRPVRWTCFAAARGRRPRWCTPTRTSASCAICAWTAARRTR
ncbi:MAG: pitrilysin family protein, partial [Chloroflexota bacterium]|nr:pitrilysin family protein [Chloroflexota bacterium]